MAKKKSDKYCECQPRCTMEPQPVATTVLLLMIQFPAAAVSGRKECVYLRSDGVFL